MSRDYTLRITQSNMDRTKRNRAKGKAISKQPKPLKHLKPPKIYKKGI